MEVDQSAPAIAAELIDKKAATLINLSSTTQNYLL
jgi:hypothetical protein